VQHELHINMEFHYFRELEAIETQIEQSADPVHLMMAHVQVVIWGALMVESFANRLRRFQLAEQVMPDALDGLWDHVKRDGTLEKLKQASKRFGAATPPAWLKGEIELRDRLVHFKDKPVKIRLSDWRKNWEEAGQPGEFLEWLPPMGIHQKLLETAIETRKDRFLEYGRVLDAAARAI